MWLCVCRESTDLLDKLGVHIRNWTRGDEVGAGGIEDEERISTDAVEFSGINVV